MRAGACGDQGLGVGHEAHGGDARRDAERRPAVGGRREAGVAEEPQLTVGVAARHQVPRLGERKPRRSASARARGGAVPRRVAGRGRHRARVERVHVREGAEGRDLRPGDQTLAARARPASAGRAREAGARGGAGHTWFDQDTRFVLGCQRSAAVSTARRTACLVVAFHTSTCPRRCKVMRTKPGKGVRSGRGGGRGGGGGGGTPPRPPRPPTAARRPQPARGGAAPARADGGQRGARADLQRVVAV